MGNYERDLYETPNQMNRQRDLVLSTNEFCFLQSKTNGAIKTYTGPTTMTISAQENLVVFNPKTKRFEETQDFDRARQLFVSAPEGWYVVLKNPASDNSHPEATKAVISPALEIGHKINIPGPCSFSLFPGQMTRTIRGHRLRSNQYLLARVYDAEAAKKGSANATMIDAEGNEIKAKQEEYFVGQMLVIKGTEVSFYIPPTGIEVIPVDNKNGEGTGTYVREAVTLERLEYAILKDEDGEKRYIHGPSVVFPKPTETFVTAPKGGLIFRALELSPISGIYVKVIAAYDEVNANGEKVHHPIGEELFITGNDQMIYYPRPEHAIIQYDGKYMHHAIAIPEGEGRYILDRLSGKIKTVKGPQMYLPDPRTEVVVKRKLSRKECELMYPGNEDVIRYNEGLSEQATERMARKGLLTSEDVAESLNRAYSTSNQESTLAIFEANANISRGVSYTKPRTITLDTKYDGVVSIDVWTGYAINIVSKTGKREIVLGPTTRLLDYDETIEAMELSTGRPKTTDRLLKTGFLRVENNKVSDVIEAQTSDFVNVMIKVSYCVNFLKEYKDKWFNVENYVKYLTDHMRSLLKREVKKHTIQDFYANSTDIVRNIVLNISDDKKEVGRLFVENGMKVYDVEVLGIGVESIYKDMLNQHQKEMVEKTLELSNAAAHLEVVTKLAEVEREEAKLQTESALYAAELRQQAEEDRLTKEEALAERRRVAEKAEADAKKDMQAILAAIQTAEVARIQEKNDLELKRQKEEAEIAKAKQTAYAETVAKIMDKVDPSLIAALQAKANAQLITDATKALSPYALANGESVADTVNTLLRGTTLENVLTNITGNKIED